MSTYLDSNKTDNAALAYALVYIVDLFETGATWNCDNFGDELNDYLNAVGSFASGEEVDK
jgi:hypothetical protein